jgi:hypothetical protein
MAITGEAYGGSMLVTGWTNQNLGQAVGTLSANLEDGAGPAGLSLSSGILNGFLAQTSEVEDTIAGTAVTAGAVYLSKLFVTSGGLTSTVWWYNTTAFSASATGSGFGLYTAAGTLVAQTTSGAGTNAKFNALGLQSAAWTTPLALNGGQTYYAAILNVTGTLGVLAEMTNWVALPTLLNANTAAATLRFASGPTGASVLPASITMSGLVATGNPHAHWIAIS